MNVHYDTGAVTQLLKRFLNKTLASWCKDRLKFFPSVPSVPSVSGIYVIELLYMPVTQKACPFKTYMFTTYLTYIASLF